MYKKKKKSVYHRNGISYLFLRWSYKYTSLLVPEVLKHYPKYANSDLEWLSYNDSRRNMLFKYTTDKFKENEEICRLLA